MNELILMAEEQNAWRHERSQALPAVESYPSRFAKRSSTLSHTPGPVARLLLATTALMTLLAATPGGAEAAIMHGNGTLDLNDGPDNGDTKRGRENRKDDRTPDEKQKSKQKSRAERNGNRNDNEDTTPEPAIVVVQPSVEGTPTVTATLTPTPQATFCGQAIIRVINVLTGEEGTWNTTCPPYPLVPIRSGR